MKLRIIVIILIIIYVRDTKAQWSKIDLGIENELTDINFVDDTLGFCIGDNSLILTTKDGGTTWSSNNQISLSTRLNKIFFKGDNGLITGNGIILTSINRGLNWEIVHYDSLLSFGNLDYYSDSKIWVSGGFNNSENHSVIYESTDFGASWQKIVDTDEILILNNNKILGLNVINDSSVIILTTPFIDPLGPTSVYKTENNGIDWNLLSNISISTRSLSTENRDTIWTWGVGGMQVSVNGGITWSDSLFKLVNENGNLETFEVEIINDLDLLNDSNVAFIEGTLQGKYSIFLNFENPFHWKSVEIPTTTRLQSIFYKNKNGIWLCGIAGELINYQPNVVSVEKTADKKHRNELYLWGNYPNPFNPKTSIKIFIKKRTSVKLVVYDILGKKIKTLIDDTLNSGNYEIEFDGSGLNSGVYYYCLISDKDIITKKLILLK